MSRLALAFVALAAASVACAPPDGDDESLASEGAIVGGQQSDDPRLEAEARAHHCPRSRGPRSRRRSTPRA